MGDHGYQHQQSHIVSQLTRDSRETRDPRSTELHSQSEAFLPKMKAHYVRSSDRLYYEGKQKHRYGKINEILGEVASEVVEDFDLPLAKASAEKTELPKMAKLPVRDYLAMKREIFYSNYNMMVKSESLTQLQAYVKQQEDVMQREEKIAKQTKALLKDFMKQEAEKVRLLKEDHLRIEEAKIAAHDQLSHLKNIIVEEDYSINRVKDDIKVLLSD